MTFAVLCPGQGAQYPDMLARLMDSAAARAVFDAADAELGTGWRDAATDPSRLFLNRDAQPLICLSQLAAWRALSEGELPRVTAFAGYSAGEVSAHACAGVFDAAGLARVAAGRARLMDDAAPSGTGLLALRGIGREQAVALGAPSGVMLAIATGEDACVMGGPQEGLSNVAEQAEAMGVQVTCLKVGLASHTSYLHDAVAGLRDLLGKSVVRAPQVPIIAGIDASRVMTTAQGIESLSRQVAQTIEWASCMDALHERGCRVFIELGPGSGLSRMLRERHVDVAARSLDEFQSVAGARAWLARECDAMSN
ncbi:Malonyl CoA acyl carrier protein transacylase [plant metagenome]|uniref:Malonyl CoA acyl carrier protein transacylase n=1 Tax=plant metagenome TaxID=1297885 RepID=A0A484TA27_9ZZZZ